METTPIVTYQDIISLLEQVKDPEIPYLSVVDMGIITSIDIRQDEVSITITPTFVGCPALEMIRSNIQEQLAQLPVQSLHVHVDYSTPWSTNRLSDRGRDLLAKHGFAPPPRFEGEFQPEILLTAACPYCGGTNTALRTPFGPALCRALYYCSTCRQTFEQFKPL